MRFVCDSCRAQYMISDEKVGAKGVKVRCKKCGFVILVRRADAAAEARPPPPPPEGDDGATQVMQNPLGQDSPAPSDPEITNPGLAPTGNGNVLGGLDEDEIGAVFDQVLTSGAHAMPEELKNGEQTAAGPALGDEDDDRMSTRVLDADTVKKLAAESGGEASLQPEAPKSEEPSYEWFVAIDEKQVGPLTVEKIKDHWDRGEIGPDSLCWRAGFSDWMALSEVAELASVLAPRPAKPVIVAPAPVGPVASVVSVPVESAFSAGGVAKTVRSEVQVPIAAAGAEGEATGWKPSAASALASLVKEEIEALTKPPSHVPEAPASEEPAPRGLLDLPLPEEKPHSNGKANGAHAPALEEPRGRPMTNPYMNPAPTYTSPGFTTYKPQSRNGLIIGVAAGGGVLLLALIGLVVFLATRQPQVIVSPPPATGPAQPPQVAQAPAQPAAANPAQPAQPAAAAPQQPAPATGGHEAAEPKGAPAPSPTRFEGVGSRSSGSRAKASRQGSSERTERPEPPPAPEKSSGDDSFEEVFGVAKKSEPAKTEKSGSKKSVYVPPAPGGGADLPDSLGQSDIMTVVLGNRAALQKCSAEHKKKEPGVSGKLIMRWTVQTSGKTSNVSVASEEFKATYMAACVGGLIKQWKFPAHKNQGPPITFPFTF